MLCVLEGAVFDHVLAGAGAASLARRVARLSRRLRLTILAHSSHRARTVPITECLGDKAGQR
jgi:hypothetical protein